MRRASCVARRAVCVVQCGSCSVHGVIHGIHNWGIWEPEFRNYEIMEFGDEALLELKRQLHRSGIFLTSFHIFYRFFLF